MRCKRPISLDSLTGLYNRVYLEFLQKQADNQKDTPVTSLWSC